MMVTSPSSNNDSKNQGYDMGLSQILSALQQGVIAVNNMTKDIAAIFPSTS